VRWAWLFSLVVACSGGSGGHSVGSGGDDNHQGDGADAGSNGSDDDDDDDDTGDGDGDQPNDEPFDVQPAEMQTLDVTQGAPVPTVMFTATQGGHSVSAAFTVDRGEAATISMAPTASAVFSPTRAMGGLVTVTAGYHGQILHRQVFIRLKASQSGATPAQQKQVAADLAALTASGGIGGVGGEGLGTNVTDKPTSDSLESPTSNGEAESLRFIYPYDGTVWPRGLPAPLLQWSWSKSDADAVRIELETTSGAYQWAGTFARPAILEMTHGKFVRHPIPQDVWDAATQTAGGVAPSGERERLTVKLTVVKGGLSAGPISQTWTIAAARLSGTIYYNSYGTQLAKNYTGAVGGDGKFGGAVLSIRVGDTGPKLTAGGDGGESECRVCHSVSADGSRLIAAYNAGGKSSSYALSPTSVTESGMTVSTSFPGIYPDGSFALTAQGKILTMPDAATADAPMGLSAVATAIGTPAFDASGKLVAFNPMASSSLTNPTKKLVVMDYDPAMKAFAGARTVVDQSALDAEHRPGWPAFLPDGASLVFHQQSKAGLDGNSDGALYTRKGAKAQIFWTGTEDASSVTPLNALNGLDAENVSYLPKLASAVSMTCAADGKQVGAMDADHADDANLNYEPTVNPVASGGYAWVVFTSRRLYGNVATIPPFCSDPRGVNLIDNITTKKLWVAAIDLGAKPGKDASHPAFYLPSQELLAGNSRGFWVLDPCLGDGEKCGSGDQCCNGYCTFNTDANELQCGNKPPDATCVASGDKCEQSSDCCDPNDTCAGGFCSVVIIK
jgi:hypothetical protein